MKMRLSTVSAIVFLLGSLAACAPAIRAEEPPSIVRSSPLSGLSGADGWINTPPLTAKQLKGKVVLVDFWDYSCINCIRAIPYIRAWADKYKDRGLVVIGVHTPEFDIEKQQASVQKAVTKFGITYPVALDNDVKVWDAFRNEFWPAHYSIDAKEKVRYEHFGEGKDEQSERWIQGNGVVTEDRLYQLVRQKGPVADHTFAIEFEDPGLQAFSFTFG
jgi:thiol-disulfide isomerase/thioredoxin